MADFPIDPNQGNGYCLQVYFTTDLKERGTYHGNDDFKVS